MENPNTWTKLEKTLEMFLSVTEGKEQRGYRIALGLEGVGLLRTDTEDDAVKLVAPLIDRAVTNYHQFHQQNPDVVGSNSLEMTIADKLRDLAVIVPEEDV